MSENNALGFQACQECGTTCRFYLNANPRLVLCDDCGYGELVTLESYDLEPSEPGVNS